MRASAKPGRAFPFWNAMPDSLTSVPRIALAIEKRLALNFVTGAGCIFHLVHFTRLILTMRGPQRFNLPLRPSYVRSHLPA
jgi:hypothetical protein